MIDGKETPLEKENQELKLLLQEANEMLEAIQKGEVESLVVQGPVEEQIYSIIGPDHPYQIFIEKMAEAAVIISGEGAIFYANPSFIALTGEEHASVIGASFLDYVQEKQRPHFLESLERKKKSEFFFITKKKETHTVSLSFSYGVWKGSKELCLLITDITEAKRIQNFNHAIEKTTKILSDISIPSITFKLLIDSLKSSLDWDLIIIWDRDKEQQTLRCSQIAHVQNLDVDEFIQKTKTLNHRGDTLAEHVWSSYRPIWIEDVCDDSTFLRRDEALKCNLHGALAFPYYFGAELGGVIELFRKKPFQEILDESLFNFIVSMGITIGLYIQRKKIESANAHFTNMISTLPSGIYSINSQGVVKTWNPSAERIYGWKAEEMVGSSIKKIYPKENECEFDTILETLNKGMALQHFRSTRMRKDKTLISIDNSYGIMNYQWGEDIEFAVVVEDITEKKAAENASIQFQDQLNSYLTLTEDIVWEVDKGGKIISLNNAAFKILGYQEEEQIGKYFFYFLAPDEREGKIAEFLESITQKKGWNGLLHFICKNGSDCWVETHSIPSLNEHNEMIGLRGVSRDVTQIKTLEKIKSEFISTVSHELRTPLISIHGALALLKAKEMTSEATKGVIEIAHKNSDKLIRLINNIMDVEKLQEGKLNFDLKK